MFSDLVPILHWSEHVLPVGKFISITSNSPDGLLSGGAADGKILLHHFISMYIKGFFSNLMFSLSAPFLFVIFLFITTLFLYILYIYGIMCCYRK